MEKFLMAEYQGCAKEFKPGENSNAEDWVKSAKDAVQKYIVITSQTITTASRMFRHESQPRGTSCMRTPFGLDPLKNLAAAWQMKHQLGFFIIPRRRLA